MRRSRLKRPQVECLEEKVLLSISDLSYFGLARNIIRRATAPTSLDSDLHGAVAADRTGEARGAMRFSGAGRIQAAARVQVEGSVRTVRVGDVTRPEGTLVLKTQRGEVTLDINGRVQADSEALPDRYRYKVSGGRGVFWKAKGSGVVLIRTDLRSQGRPHAFGRISPGGAKILIRTDPNS